MSGMATYKSQFSTTSGSRLDGADPAPQRTTSTRLPTRKHIPIQPQPSAPAQRSPSKLTKKRPTQNAEGTRGATAQKGAIPRAVERRTGGQATPSSTIMGTHTSSETPQGRSMLPTSSSRMGRLDPPYARTPSLVSGSSASTNDSPKSNVLRRKPSNIGSATSRVRKESIESHEDTAVMDTLNALSDPFPDSILGIQMPPTSLSMSKENVLEAHIDPLAGAYAPPILTTGDLPPPTAFYTLSATPSTGYSGSPGPFSVASTPTSMSSFSPATTVTSKGAPRVRQPSPTRNRPPVTKRRTDESEEKRLSSVRESSSSSGSTVRGGDSGRIKERLRVDLLPAPPPSPPVPPQTSAARPRTSYDKKSETIAMSPRPNTAIPPPELAHLVDAKPIQRGPGASRPVRPSREGTPDYVGLRDPSPIIQSNMSSLPSSIHRRQTSSESRGTGASSVSTTSKSRLPPPSKLPSRAVSPSPSQFSAQLSPTTRTPVTRGTTPEIPSDTERRTKRNGHPPSPNKSSSRFGFFRRKTEPVTSQTTTASKSSRKGPMAGTGHEGYGKFSYNRGRSGSTTSGASSGRSPSADSGSGSASRTVPSRKSSVGSKGAPEMDDFLLERLAPVTLRGSGDSGSTQDSRSGLERSQSEEVNKMTPEQDAVAADAAMSRSVAIPGAEYPFPVLRPTQSDQPQRSESPVKRDRSAPPTTQSSSKFGFKSLGGRRLSRMSLNMDGKIPPASMASSNVSSVAPSPHIASSKTWQSSTDASSSSMHVDVAQRSATQPLPKPQGKLARKFNFFQRAHNSSKQDIVPPLAAAPPLAFQPSNRSMAHYALMDGEQQKVDINELEQIMQEANESPDDQEPAPMEENLELDPGIEFLPEGSHEDLGISLSPEMSQQELSRPAHGDSILLPERPFLAPALEHPNRPTSPIVQVQRDSPERYVLPRMDRSSPILQTVLDTSVLDSSVQADPQTSPLVPMPPQRPPRLQQVGRIPHVKRDRERKLSVHSFSRPFGNDGSPALQQQSPPIGSSSPEPENGAFPQPPPLNEMVTQLRLPSFIDEIDAALNMRPMSAQTATTIDPTAMDSTAEFLAFPPRKDSDISASTSSGHPSFKTMLATAQPQPLSPPAATPTEDEVWQEYDDLIDDVLERKTPRASKKRRQPPALPLGAPFHPNASQSSLGHNSEMRRPSNTSSALQLIPSVATPKSPYSITDFVAAYGSRGASMASVDPSNVRLSLPPAVRTSSGSNRHSVPSSARPSSQPSSQPTTESQTATSQRTTLSSSPSTSPKRDRLEGYESRPTPDTLDTDTDDNCTTCSQPDEDTTLENMANVRLGALMTSKWLSFGRVLFSPAHFELRDPKEDRVLIIDGLGKDWSYYVALTYPTASVYSLGPDPSSSANPNVSSGPLQSMPNHRHFHHPMLSAPFPFPKGFFAAVVFRFPAVASEGAYRTALFECKRVLRPGGYLEISVLDMDPVNMGNRARKAVKGLKMAIAEKSPEVCLRPVSDVMMKLLGRRGFENMQRCMVGVPAAGPVKRSGDLGAASPPQGFSQGAMAESGLKPPASGPTKSLSFTDLLQDQNSSSSSSDSNDISRMVARVGRWWYERCYESTVLPSTEGDQSKQSIWGDDALLSECEKRGTTFRMLICYAQKPTGVFRRTVSV